MVISVLFSACSILPAGLQATEDNTYLTPIAESTLAAFDWRAPIENKLQAAIAARANLATTRLHFAGAPRIVLAEKMSLEDAHRRIAQAAAAGSETRPGEAPVWLVLFEGDYQIIPPDPEHTITPPPPAHGCGFVILDPDGSSGSEIGTLNCPP